MQVESSKIHDVTIGSQGDETVENGIFGSRLLPFGMQIEDSSFFRQSQALQGSLGLPTTSFFSRGSEYAKMPQRG